jgi:hypothetical protein
VSERDLKLQEYAKKLMEMSRAMEPLVLATREA